MEQLWNRLQHWLAHHAPSLLDDMNEGAAEEDITAAEQQLGIRLPDDFRAFLQIHNGQKYESKVGLIGDYMLLSIEDIQGEWSIWKSLYDSGAFTGMSCRTEGAVRGDEWWHPGWIPITYDGSGNHHCLDFRPAPGGRIGQVIMVWHDDPRRIVVAPSFTEWMTHIAERLENGTYRLEEENGAYHFNVYGFLKE